MARGGVAIWSQAPAKVPLPPSYRGWENRVLASLVLPFQGGGSRSKEAFEGSPICTHSTEEDTDAELLA